MRVAPLSRPESCRAPGHAPAILLRTACALALAGLAGSASAAPPTEAQFNELQAKLDKSLVVIEQLAQRLQALEKAPAAAPATAATAAAPGEWGSAVTQRLEDLSQQVTAIGNRAGTTDGLPLHGFLDVGALSTGQRGIVRKGGTVGSLDFYLTAQYGQVRTLAELNFEVSPGDGSVGSDLERLQAGYTFNDSLTLWLGRFHAPYGYWNTAYHHGGQIQPSILRPRFLDFEDRGGILPAHNVGLWANGKIPVGGQSLHYDAWLANAPRIGDDGTLNQNQSGATNGRALLGGNLATRFGDTTLGLHALSGHIGGPVDGSTASALRVLGGYALYDGDDWEAMSEFFGFDNRNNDGSSHRSHAFYVHAGRNLGAWTPYARYELASLDQGDSYFALQNSGQSYKRGLLGIRYELDPRSTLKFELNRTRLTDRTTDSFTESRLQYAVRF